MVMVLSVARVLALLGVCPATHLLQAACRVPSLDQAQGLQGADSGKVKDLRHHRSAPEGNMEVPGDCSASPRDHQLLPSGCRWHSPPSTGACQALFRTHAH